MANRQMEQYKRDHDNGLHDVSVLECPACEALRQEENDERRLDRLSDEEAHAEGLHADGYESECEYCLVLQHEAEHAVNSDPECELCREAADPKAPVDEDDDEGYCNVC